MTLDAHAVPLLPPLSTCFPPPLGSHTSGPGDCSNPPDQARVDDWSRLKWVMAGFFRECRMLGRGVTAGGAQGA